MTEKAQEKYKFATFHKPLSPEFFIEIFRHLNKIFPECFSLTNVRPFKKQIIKDLFASEEVQKLEYSRIAISRFMCQYTYTPEYMNAHQTGAMRIDLQGNPTEEVTEQEFKAKTSSAKFYKKKYNIE